MNSMLKFSSVLLIVRAAEEAKDPSSSCGPVDCEPNGKCEEGECVCDPGFAGADCSFPFQTCPDGILTCFNGAECVLPMPKLFDDSPPRYFCECAGIAEASPFQIKQCESPESEACVAGRQTSDYAFCTNGGKCISKVQYGEPHAGCRCPDEFEGRHCQYRKGTAPDVELQLAYQEKEHHTEGLFLSFIILIVGCVLGGLFCLPIVRHQRSYYEKPTFSQKDLDDVLDDIMLETNDSFEASTKGEMT